MAGIVKRFEFVTSIYLIPALTSTYLIPTLASTVLYHNLIPAIVQLHSKPLAFIYCLPVVFCAVRTFLSLRSQAMLFSCLTEFPSLVLPAYILSIMYYAPPIYAVPHIRGV